MKYNFLLVLLFLSLSCTKVKPRKPINPKPTTTLYKQTIAENKKLNKIEEDNILNFIAKDTSKTYIQSSNGFWYAYIKKTTETSKKPKIGDEVTFEYDIKNLNNTIIYSKKDLGLKKYIVDKEDIISGLQKGIKLMKKGETITFVFPSYNAYGITGDGNKIGINTSIISTVTLINIK